MTARIFITDDHQVFVDGLNLLLSDMEGFEVVGTANNITDTINYLSSDVDVLLLDISLDNQSSIPEIPKIREAFPHVKIAMLSMHGDYGHVSHAISKDVDAYILKNTSGTELKHAIEQLMSGEKYYSIAVSEVLVNGAVEKEKSDTLSKLSKREIEIIRLIAKEKTTVEIAESLKLSKYTVDTHRKNILSKLSAKTAAGITKFAIKHNLID